MTTTSHVDYAAAPDVTRAVLRQIVATVAYRAAKVLRDVPDGFVTTAFGSATRKPVLIVAHMADLMAWGVTIARGDYKWEALGGGDWDTEVRRFFDGLASLDAELAREGPLVVSVDRMIQGPLADVLTHIGQLAMLRGMAGAPVRPESYARADIVAGRVGWDQAAARAEFDGDASVRR